MWFKSDRNLAFQNLTLRSSIGMGGRGFQRTANNITIAHPRIEQAAIEHASMGRHWTNRQQHDHGHGDSGMLLGFDASKPGNLPGGRNYRVTGNTITETGMNATNDSHCTRESH